MEILKNAGAERATLAGISKFGAEAYFDIADIINNDSFSIDSNQIIWKCFKYILDKDSSTKLDLPTVLSAANDLGIKYFFEKSTEIQHLQAIMDFPVQLSNIRKFAQQIRKLQITRSLYKELENVQEQLLEITGTENLTQILSLAEDKVLNFSSILNDIGEAPKNISNEIYKHIEGLEKEVVDQKGIPSGLPMWDVSIGGGLRPASINLIGARPKVGKSSCASNIGMYVASKLKIPVLKLDIEMTCEDDTNRIIAMMSEVPLTDIETGQYTKNYFLKNKVRQAGEILKNTPYYFKSIGGNSIEEILSIARRWIMKEVGTNSDGTAKSCVLIYDFLKMTDMTEMGNVQEYQALGFAMGHLQNFALKYKIPIILFTQLNRDGISKDDGSIISGSDRLLWTAANFSILKLKSDEELAMDGPTGGNRKLFTVASRFGPSMDEYISLNLKGYCTKLEYLGSKSEITAANQKNNFEVVENDIPFV